MGPGRDRIAPTLDKPGAGCDQSGPYGGMLLLPVQPLDKDMDCATTGKADLLYILLFGNAEFEHLRLAIFYHFHRCFHNGGFDAATAY